MHRSVQDINEDMVQTMLMGLVILFSQKGLKLAEPDEVAKIQRKYYNMLFREGRFFRTGFQLLYTYATSTGQNS